MILKLRDLTRAITLYNHLNFKSIDEDANQQLMEIKFESKLSRFKKDQRFL